LGTVVLLVDVFELVVFVEAIVFVGVVFVVMVVFVGDFLVVAEAVREVTC